MKKEKKEKTLNDMPITLMDNVKEIFLDKTNIPIYLLMIVMIVFMINFKIIKVSGNSMDSTLADKQIHLAQITKEINRNDIVVVNSNFLECIIIKRVIALPGDSIEIFNNRVYVNDKEISEPYLKEDMIQNVNVGKYTLQEDEYWVMGDNRNHSTDSRVIGPVSINEIIGKMIK